MIVKKPIFDERIRKIGGSFAFIEHRFLRDGYFSVLSHQALLLYVFLVLVADREGLSYYGQPKICRLLGLNSEGYTAAREELIARDLIAFDGTLFQVLSLPAAPRPGETRMVESYQGVRTAYPSVTPSNPKPIRQRKGPVSLSDIFMKAGFNGKNYHNPPGIDEDRS